MMLLISILLSVLVCGAVLAVLMWVKTPHYQVSEAQVIRLLEWVLLGQATENQWRVFCGLPIRNDPRLDDIRQRCLEIDEAHFVGQRRQGYLLDNRGLEAVRELLEQLQTTKTGRKGESADSSR